MTPLQRYSLFTKCLYVFQRLAILGFAAFVAVKGETLVALAFLWVYDSTPTYDNVLKTIRDSIKNRKNEASTDNP